MFDAHTHLNSDQLYPNRTQHIYDFITAGWTHLVSVWIDDIYNQRNIAICEERSTHSRFNDCTIKSSVGIHPCSIWNSWYTTLPCIDTHIRTLSTQFEEYSKYLVAVWECWIDAHRWDYTTTQKLQRYAFEQQCILAQQLNLPIIIHSRSQRSDTLAILKQRKNLRIYLHCRWYSPKEVEQANATFPNLRIWFCGNTTYPRAQSLRDSLQLARQLQTHWGCSVVIETDAPYLAPQTYRWKQNLPKYLAESARTFSQIIWTSLDVLLDTTHKNACKLYSLDY